MLNAISLMVASVSFLYAASYVTIVITNYFKAT